MNVTELRIGNLVLDDNGKVVKVESILGSQYKVSVHSLDEEILTELRLDQIKPIKLSIDHLFLYGFEQVETYYDLWCIFEKDRFKIQFMYEDGFRMTRNNISIDYKYLHNLQNLHFILEGEELDVDIIKNI